MEISGTIEKLSEISSTIAAAVEEQGAATQEISRNVQQAALGNPTSLLQHRRRATRCWRDRLGFVAGSLRSPVAVQRQQPAQARSWKILEHSQGRVITSRGSGCRVSRQEPNCKNWRFRSGPNRTSSDVRSSVAIGGKRTWRLA